MATRDQLQQFFQDHPSSAPSRQRPSTRPSERPAQRPDDRPGSRSERPGGRPERLSRDRKDQAQKIRDNIQNDRPNRGDWFTDNFWDRHDYRPPYYRDHLNWGRLATPIGVTSWLGWPYQPYSYGYYYGDGYYSGYYDDEYYGEEAYEPLDYAEQAAAIEGGVDLGADDDWMPLGVFALSKEETTTATPNIYLQLALNRQGTIAGTAYNTITDQTYGVEGLVDQEGQRAAWKITEKASSPIMETGVYNLGDPETMARAYFADGRTQDVFLVRIES